VAEPAYVFAGGVVAGGVLQLGLQLPFLWKQGMRFTPLLSFRHPAVRKVGKLMIPGIFGVGISQINFALSRMIASLLEEGRPGVYPRDIFHCVIDCLAADSFGICGRKGY